MIAESDPRWLGSVIGHPFVKMLQTLFIVSSKTRHNGTNREGD